tara:strand:+ start:294 stop:524 length:231 start_codon:yes stop_codon:yes gene_type:complete
VSRYWKSYASSGTASATPLTAAEQLDAFLLPALHPRREHVIQLARHAYRIESFAIGSRRGEEQGNDTVDDDATLHG